MGLSSSAYIILFSIIFSFLLYDHLLSKKTQDQANNIVISDTSINQISEYSLSMDLAQSADLPIVTDTIAKTELAIADLEGIGFRPETSSVKAVPIFDLGDVGREIKYHIIKDNEDIESIAEQYNLNINTIKWVNNLKNNKLKVGQKLKILPLDGIIYKIKKGDDLTKIATKYKASIDRITIFNDLEIATIKSGQEIVIPEGILPKKERPDYIAPVIRRAVVYNYNNGYSNSYSVSASGFYGTYSNPYPNRGIGDNRAYYGQCTWWVTENFNRRGDIRLKGKMTGHAYQWSSTLPGLGFKHSKLPVVGAVYQTSGGGGGYGHVGFVTAVKKDESGKIIGYTISEMNAAGWNVVNSRNMNVGGNVNFYY